MNTAEKQDMSAVENKKWVEVVALDDISIPLFVELKFHQSSRRSCYFILRNWFKNK